jgi:enoyl-CoA hydratase
MVERGANQMPVVGPEAQGGDQIAPRQTPGRTLFGALPLAPEDDAMEAQEAHRIGLVNQVVPAAELMASAEAVAGKIAANGPVAVRQIKETVRRTLALPEEEAFVIEDECVEVVMNSEDAKEGPLAFVEKRQPRYLGR